VDDCLLLDDCLKDNTLFISEHVALQGGVLHLELLPSRGDADQGVHQRDTLERLTREEAEQLIKRHGGRVTVTVSRKTAFLLVGEGGGRGKYSAVKDLIDEDGLFAIIAASCHTLQGSNLKWVVSNLKWVASCATCTHSGNVCLNVPYKDMNKLNGIVKTQWDEERKRWTCKLSELEGGGLNLDEIARLKRGGPEACKLCQSSGSGNWTRDYLNGHPYGGEIAKLFLLHFQGKSE
jgi:hypothetical protein